ncbi:exonuclease SbcCD subunit D [Acidithiobacillus sp. IBUN Pt1247-S3]|uniref:metallophosphoesterase family protein n=1 Tax=Acidithiobacillus sp. IBUN Pt1247-S3 TaxID=3166642 RepID=UPI0034E4251E
MLSNPQGLLFIGDPHLSSVRPGRRLDNDFAGTVLDALDQSLTLAREHQWQPIILGDLFDRAPDNGLSMLSRLFWLLRRHLQKDGLLPWCLVGNHDLRDGLLGDDTALGCVRASGLLRVLETREAPEPVHLPGLAWVLPLSYASSIDTLAPMATLCKQQENLPVIALTHQDLAFPGMYPQAQPLISIPGVDLVVNGHMHKPQPWVRKENTLWCNPGNITRMSIDCEEQEPAVWSWPAKKEGLERHVLRHEKKIFDRTGMRTQPDEGALREALATPAGIPESQFSDLLKQQDFGAMTEDAAILQEELEAVLQERKVDPVVSEILRQMALGL